MSVRILYGETKVGQPIDISAHLLATGIASGDITDAIFYLKVDRTAADDADGVYSAKLGSGSLTQAGAIFTAFISDWAELLVETKYYIGFGIKISGDAYYREIKLSADTNTMYFDQDVIRA